ncbi:MAG: CcdB family protein [Archangium sp.]
MNQQFTVFKNQRPNKDFPFLVAVQHPLLASLPTRLVIPMTPLKKLAPSVAPRLNPVVEIAGVKYVLMTHLLGAVDASALQVRAGDLSDRRSEIIAAIDVMLSGV